jgi:hypothetical protein
MAVSFSVSLTDVNSAAVGEHDAIIANAQVAADYLSRYLVGNANIEIEMRVEEIGNGANGSSAATVFRRHTGGFDIADIAGFGVAGLTVARAFMLS